MAPYNLSEIITALSNNAVGIFPCDTVWGLIGRVTDPVAHRINRLKQRPLDQPLIQLIAHRDMIMMGDSKLSDAQEAAISQYWPGPTTLIIPTGSGKVAYRQPDFPILNQLLNTVNHPLYSTSVNRTGEEPAKGSICQIPESWNAELEFCYTAVSPGSTVASRILDLSQTPFKWLR